MGHDVPEIQKTSLAGEWRNKHDQKKDNPKTADWKEVFGSGPDGLRALVQQVVQEVLEAEMEETVVRARASAAPIEWLIGPDTTRQR